MKTPKTKRNRTAQSHSVQRLVSLLWKSYSVYSVLNPDNPDRMPYVLINSESKRVTTDICNELNRLRKQANAERSDRPDKP